MEALGGGGPVSYERGTPVGEIRLQGRFMVRIQCGVTTLDVFKGARFPIEGERCVVSGGSRFKRWEVNEEEKKKPGATVYLYSSKTGRIVISFKAGISVQIRYTVTSTNIS